MKVVFLQHSGVLVRLAHCSLVFDCETGRIPREYEKDRLIFFASHAHEDHYNAGILEYGRRPASRLFSKVQYVFSKDIMRKYRRRMAELEELQILEVKPSESYRLHVERADMKGSSEILIRTLRSTDVGVAFLVQTEGLTIYHAGDLNCWTWSEDSKQHQNQMIAEYRREIDKLQGIPIDLAFVPLDPRLEDYSGSGMDYFLDHTQTANIWPIHMWGEFALIDSYKEGRSEEEQGRIHRIHKNGQVFEFF